MIVLDASAVGTFLIPDEDGVFARFARDVCLREELHGPSHWHVEIASLLRKARWRKRLTDAQVEGAARVADEIARDLIIAPPPPVGELLIESVRLGLSTYDCGYFLLARTLGCPILTDDGALRRVAAEQGLPVLLP